MTVRLGINIQAHPFAEPVWIWIPEAVHKAVMEDNVLQLRDDALEAFRETIEESLHLSPTQMKKLIGLVAEEWSRGEHRIERAEDDGA